LETPWWLLDQLTVDHEDDPAGLAAAVSDLTRRLTLDTLPPYQAGYRWGPEGLWRETPPRTLATWRWFAARLLDELSRRRAQAAADAATAERRRAALAAYERSRTIELASGSVLSRAEQRFVIDYFLLADSQVATRVAITPTARAVREVLGECGHGGDGWAWDTIRRRALGVNVTRTPDGHSGIVPWREVLKRALATIRPVSRQETLF
jgi:hypothetical protein